MRACGGAAGSQVFAAVVVAAVDPQVFAAIAFSAGNLFFCSCHCAAFGGGIFGFVDTFGSAFGSGDTAFGAASSGISVFRKFLHLHGGSGSSAAGGRVCGVNLAPASGVEIAPAGVACVVSVWGGPSDAVGPCNTGGGGGGGIACIGVGRAPTFADATVTAIAQLMATADDVPRTVSVRAATGSRG